MVQVRGDKLLSASLHIAMAFLNEHLPGLAPASHWVASAGSWSNTESMVQLKTVVGWALVVSRSWKIMIMLRIVKICLCIVR